MSSIPLIIYGTVTESGSGTPDVTVKARNETTNQTLSTTADNNGQYVFDAANFTDGYQDGDLITIYTIYSNFEGQETVTIALPLYSYEQDIILSTIEDSELIDYCTVQDVYDELDGKTNADISTQKIINQVQRAEAKVDLKTDTSFKINIVTDEVYSFTRYNSDISPTYLDRVNPFPQRSDRWGYIQNQVKVNNNPIISITSLSVNRASSVNSDSWTVLTEQTGSGGDFMATNKDAGIIEFLNEYPSLGERSWKISYTWGHDPDSTDRMIQSRVRLVRQITALLSAKYVLSTKSSGSIFDSTRDIRIGTIEIKGAGQSTSTHIRDIDNELADLWNTLGDMNVEVI